MIYWLDQELNEWMYLFVIQDAVNPGGLELIFDFFIYYLDRSIAVLA